MPSPAAPFGWRYGPRKSASIVMKPPRSRSLTRKMALSQPWSISVIWATCRFTDCAPRRVCRCKRPLPIPDRLRRARSAGTRGVGSALRPKPQSDLRDDRRLDRMKLRPQHWRLTGLVTWIPYAWLVAFFLLPFLIVLKMSLSQSAIAQPPYTPVFDLSFGWSGVMAFFAGLSLDNFIFLGSDP